MCLRYEMTGGTHDAPGLAVLRGLDSIGGAACVTAKKVARAMSWNCILIDDDFYTRVKCWSKRFVLSLEGRSGISYSFA